MLALYILEVTSLAKGNKLNSVFYLVKTEVNAILCLPTQTPLVCYLPGLLVSSRCQATWW